MSKVGKLDLEQVLRKALTPENRDDFHLFCRLIFADVKPNTKLTIKSAVELSGLSGKFIRACLDVGLFPLMREAHNRFVFFMPSWKAFMKWLRLGGSYKRGLRAVSQIEYLDIGTVRDLETALVRISIENRPGKRSLAWFGRLIHRSRTTARNRMEGIEGLEITANWVTQVIGVVAEAKQFLYEERFWTLVYIQNGYEKWRKLSSALLPDHNGNTELKLMQMAGWKTEVRSRTVSSYAIA